VPHLFELYFLHNMLEGDPIDPVSFFVNQLYSAVISSAHRIVIGGLITSIARLVGVELNPDDRVVGLEWLNLAAFEQMKFYKVDGGRICWIYPGNKLMSLSNVDRTSLLNQQISTFCPLMKSWRDLHHLLHLLTLGLLAHPNHPPLMIILTCMLPFSQFKRSKLLNDLM